MEQFYYETHAHTSEVSNCGNIKAKKLVQMYIEAGYSGVVITDHYSKHTFSKLDGYTYEEKIEYYLTGWQKAKAAAGNNLTILLGMELTFYQNDSDYLVYGIDEEFLLKHPDLLDMGISNFSKLAHDHGLLVYQAHPFRNHMTITPPHLLDGIEVFNGNKRHDSRNDIAKAWAEKFNLRTIGGSDFHEIEDLACGGIITSTKIVDNHTLIENLKSGVMIK